MARFNNGWIKIYRSVAEGDVAQVSPFVLGVFFKILLWANYMPGKVKFAGKPVDLKPGQLVTGLRDLSPMEDEDPYLHRVRTALRYLETRGTITQVTSNQGRLITVCNWEKYQLADDDARLATASEAQTGRKRGANDAQLTEEGKKEESKNRFDDLYEIYPRRDGDQGKKKAFAKLEREFKTDKTFARILAATRNYRRHCDEKGRTGTEYVKKFVTFVNGVWTEWEHRSPPQQAELYSDLKRLSDGAA